MYTNETRALSPALQQIAMEQLNEVPQRLSADIAALREWLQLQPHLCCCLEAQFLLAFLRGSKFSMEKAKQKIDRFYTLQAAIPEIFNGHRLANDTLVLDIIRTGVLLRIPLAAGDVGPAMTIIRVGSYDTSKYKFQDIIRVGSMFGEIMMFEDDNATVSGYVEIMDMSGITAANLFTLQPELLRKFAAYANEAMPIRQKGIHFINVPAAFETGFNTLRSLFPARINQRVTVSADPEAIFGHARAEYLPVEYGGTRGSLADIIAAMEQKLTSYSEYFEQSQHFGANEKLRQSSNVGSYGTRDSYFGIDGYFRQLDID